MPMRLLITFFLSRVSITGLKHLYAIPRSSKLYAVVNRRAVFAEPIVPYLKYSLPVLFIGDLPAFLSRI